MNELLLNKLKNTSELIADEHDGSYELIRAIIDGYRDVDESTLDYKDLNAVYLMAVGTWRHSVSVKKQVIDQSHLQQDKKAELKSLIDLIKDKSEEGKYSNHKASDGGAIGMFGTGFYSFQNKTDIKSPKAFIRMCIDISEMTNDDEIYNRAAQVLTRKFKGMKAASASMILHCLIPETFPILNSNMGSENIFAALDIPLKRKSDLDTYIENCRKIKAFRDENLPFKNYRILDMAAWELNANQNPIATIIKKYKDDFSNRDKNERYKWEAVQCFRDNWDINAENFHDMLSRSLEKSANLLSSSMYFAKGQILFFAEKESEIVHDMFLDLANESKDLIERIDKFTHSSDALLEKYKNDKMKQHYQGANTISTYLFFLYPEKYYIYKYNKFKEFAKKIGYEATIIAGHNQNVLAYYDMCDMVRSEVIKDSELLALSQKRLDESCYKDPEFHLLTDDIVYFGNLSDEAYWPSFDEYDPGISKEQWTQLIKDKGVFNDTAVTIMKRMLDNGGEASCTELSQKYGETKDFYNMGAIRLAQRIFDVTQCPMYLDGKIKDSKWWPILFIARNSKPDEAGQWIWKLRPELREALEETLFEKEVVVPMQTYYKNLILYGPPGTGKTYHTVNYAVAIIEYKPLDYIMAEDYAEVLARYNQYKESGQIEFTTFHQSFGYEEFIEGIKPSLFSGEDESGDIVYEMTDGIFKAFCHRADIPLIKKDNDFGFSEFPTVWKVSLAGTGDNAVRQDCMLNDYIRIGWDEYGPTITDETNFDYGGKNVLNAFINRMQKGDIILSCYSERTIDAVGVVEGNYEWRADFKDYMRTRKVHWLVKGLNHYIVDLNQNRVMTLSTVYKINVTVSDVINIVENYIKSESLASETPLKYVFIIDEINRGNISKIFGELITLIESSKRIGQKEAMRVKLPYSQKLFGVPDNVYIIGTMNTADRSIALLDTALRRRFKFIEMQPDAAVLNGLEVDGVSISSMLEKINRRIEALYDREHTIGHAYFMELKENNTIEKLADIFEHDIIPLLQEYFYEDYKKIRLVLGDAHKELAEQFVLEDQKDYSALFSGAEYDSDEVYTYRINKAAFMNIYAYSKI